LKILENADDAQARDYDSVDKIEAEFPNRTFQAQV
jgi:hypothetical protein